MVEVTGVEPVSNNQQHNKELQALLVFDSIRSNQQTPGREVGIIFLLYLPM